VTCGCEHLNYSKGVLQSNFPVWSSERRWALHQRRRYCCYCQ